MPKYHYKSDHVITVVKVKGGGWSWSAARPTDEFGLKMETIHEGVAASKKQAHSDAIGAIEKGEFFGREK